MFISKVSVSEQLNRPRFVTPGKCTYPSLQRAQPIADGRESNLIGAKMKTLLNPDGQPLSAGFNSHRRLERDISEMLGLAKGILFDGKVVDEEAVLLGDWIAAHPDLRDTWPVDILNGRLGQIFADGIVTEAERSDLKELLNQLVGGEAGLIGTGNAATTLPLDKPAPSITFRDQVFVLTGKFAFGPRTECERFTAEAGGLCEDNVTLKTRYLVIGTFGSRDWIHTSHGRKIERVLAYRKSGARIAIVGEDHWAASLPKSR